MGKKRKKTEKYSTLQNLWYVMSGAKYWQPSVPYLLGVQAITQGVSVYVWLYAVKMIIIKLNHSIPVASGINEIIKIVLPFAALEMVLLIGSNTCSKQAEGRMYDVRFKFIQMWMTKILTMPYEMMENPKVHDIRQKSSRAFGDMNSGIQGMHTTAGLLFPNLISMMVATVILITLTPAMVAVLLGLSIIRFILMDRVAIWEKVETWDKIMPERRKSFYLHDVTVDFDFAKDIRLFRMQKPLTGIMNKVNNGIHQKVVLAKNKWCKCNVVCDAIEFLQEGIMYVWLIYMVMTKGLLIADFILYVGSVRSFTGAVSQVLTSWSTMKMHSRQVTDFREMLACTNDTETERSNSNFKKDYSLYGVRSERTKESIPVPADGLYTFEFDHVSFKYPGSDNYALKDLTLILKAGKRLALVGLNGAGKSTCIKLLCRLYETTKGTIYMNGMDISKFPRKEYYRLIAPVFQQDESYAFTLAQNISMQPRATTDRELAKKCVFDADLGDTVEGMKNGIDTEIFKFLHDDGRDLSGGQKQKLMLARALYKRAPIVVLDEPTASLDAIAEFNSYMNFDRLIGGKTAVYISHRLSSTRFCHNIAMFADGKMIEYGTHDDLMAAGGEYAKLFELQAQYYVEEAQADV